VGYSTVQHDTALCITLMGNDRPLGPSKRPFAFAGGGCVDDAESLQIQINTRLRSLRTRNTSSTHRDGEQHISSHQSHSHPSHPSHPTPTRTPAIRCTILPESRWIKGQCEGEIRKNFNLFEYPPPPGPQNYVG
jgi:hypothetical protein